MTSAVHLKMCAAKCLEATWCFWLWKHGKMWCNLILKGIFHQKCYAEHQVLWWLWEVSRFVLVVSKWGMALVHAQNWSHACSSLLASAAHSSPARLPADYHSLLSIQAHTAAFIISNFLQGRRPPENLLLNLGDLLASILPLLTLQKRSCIEEGLVFPEW